METKNAIAIALILLTYLLVISSWIHYNVSIDKYPYILNKGLGIIRFSFDICIVFSYLWLINLIFELHKFMLTFTLVYIFYAAWDLIRIMEYWSQENQRKELVHRCIINFIFFALLLILYLLYSFYLYRVKFDWGCIVLFYITVLIYRYAKLRKYMHNSKPS